MGEKRSIMSVIIQRSVVMKYCNKCGGQVEDDDVFCGYCGNKLQDDAKQDSKSIKRDFEEFSFSEEDNFSESFDKISDKEFDKTDEFSKSESNIEFESHVENNPFQSSSTNSNNAGSGHKQLQPNKFAKDAQTYGILALIFGLLGGILGMVFAILGITRAKKALELCATGEYDGKTKATNGRILSIVGIVAFAFWFVFYIL